LKLALSVTRTIDNTLLLSIPAFDPVTVISSPANTVAVELYIVACSCNMNNPDSGVEKFSTKMEIDYVSKQLPAQKLELVVKAEQDNIAVVMIALKYTINKKGNLFEINDKRWMPAGTLITLYITRQDY
jgi:hypothetical protein